MVACDTTVRGAWEYARSKTSDFCARASRFDVTPRFDPRNPARSARVDSKVTRMILGLDAAADKPTSKIHNRPTFDENQTPFRNISTSLKCFPTIAKEHLSPPSALDTPYP